MNPLWPAILSLIVVALMFTAIWRTSVVRSDAGIVDLFWGPGFVLLGLTELSVSFPPAAVGWVVLGLAALWASRLSVHLHRRHRLNGVEDPRYAAMRQAGGPDWPKESLWRVFLVQALALWAISTPLHAALLPGAGQSASPILAGLGIVLFVAGFAIEAIADAQLARFKADPAHKGALCSTGLFAYCRHPNYLGEIILWWGLGLVALGLTGRVWALVGPALLTFFIVKVSGVPPLNAVLAKRPGYAEWAARTPALWPRFRA